MKKIKSFINYFTKGEIALWLVSVLAVFISYFVSENDGCLSLIASLIGVTALIFNAKGNPIGQFLGIIFAVLYGIISYTFSYYGEMITYLCMTAPMALIALISWLRNPYNGSKSEVKVNRLKAKEIIFLCVLTAVVTTVFYFVLDAFNTANLTPSTLSVTTSFVAVYLTFRRSPFYAIAYAANDLVLIVMWILATLTDITYLSVIVCFIMFLVNDIYGFVNWRRMQKRQSQSL